MRVLFLAAMLAMSWSGSSAAAEPSDRATIDMMDKAAMAEPAKYIETLINCAAYHGIVAIQQGEDGVGSEEHDDMAIMLLSAANLVPPKDSEAISAAYTDKLFAFKQDIDNDKDGQVQKDLMKLGATCLMVEQYAAATVLKAENDETENPTPKSDDEAVEDVIAALFAAGTDDRSAYRSVMMDCAGYHGTRVRREVNENTATDEKSAKLFLDAAAAIDPVNVDAIDADYSVILAKFKDALDNDTTGEARREYAGMQEHCSDMATFAQRRVEKARAAMTADDS